MTTQVFLILLLVVSTLVSLTVEALKKVLSSNISSNIIVAIVSVVLSVVVGIFYCILTETAFDSQLIVYLISLIFLSWLCAMLGYDKVMQTLKQIGGI